MSDDFVFKAYETQAELMETKQKLNETKQELNETKQELNETRQELKRILEEHKELTNQIAANNVIKTGQHNEIPEKQNKSTQVLKKIENDLEKQTILLLGGTDGNKVLDTLLILEDNEQNWKELNIKLPYPIMDHGAQFLYNNLYIFGGTSRRSTLKLSKSLQWKKMADMNKERSDISNSSVILNNKIWVCGGSGKSVEMYDPLTNKWKYMKEMNYCQDNPAAAVVNGKIFCSHYDSVECYDPSSNVWTLICNMPRKIWGHGAVEMNGNFILMGGHTYEGRLENVWALDTTDKNAVWIEKASMPIPRSYFSIAKIDGNICVCGGQSKKCVARRNVLEEFCCDEKETYIYDVEVFDGEVWRHCRKMPTRRSQGQAVVIPMEFARKLE